MNFNLNLMRCGQRHCERTCAAILHLTDSREISMSPPRTLRDLASSKNTGTLALTVVAAALFAAVLWWASDYLREVAHGPQPATLTQLSKMGPDAFGRWFTVTAEVRPGHCCKPPPSAAGAAHRLPITSRWSETKPS